MALIVHAGLSTAIEITCEPLREHTSWELLAKMVETLHECGVHATKFSASYRTGGLCLRVHTFAPVDPAHKLGNFAALQEARQVAEAALRPMCRRMGHRHCDGVLEDSQ